MRFEGAISLIDHAGKKLKLDCEPHVMSRIRKIFDNSQSYWERGEFTHKPILFSMTLSACRDLQWVMQRYHLRVDTEVLKVISDKGKEYDDIVEYTSAADKDSASRISPDALELNGTLREHQIQFQNMFRQVKRMLLADKMGLGKTVSAISVLVEPQDRPAMIVVPPTLCTQWERELKRFLPQISTHVIRGFKNYDLPKVDVIITSYNRLSPWQDVIFNDKFEISTVIFDEVHELRHGGTAKREFSRKLSQKAKRCLGLSGTPIFNQGGEIWSVLDSIKPGCLGTEDDFQSEWCVWGKVNEPATLNNFLKTQGLFLRRTPEEVGLTFGQASKHVYTIDADMAQLQAIENVTKMLAMTVLSGRVGADSDAAREFDWKLRHATGVAKARPVAEFVKMMLEEGEKVLLVGWHRDVYDVWMKEFKAMPGAIPVMFTGSESIREKEKAVKDFTEGDANIFIISLRSGAGLDGLQHACNTAVFGELDWSPHVMDQVLARLDRDGQKRHVTGYYLTIADGADPFMVSILGDKRSQHDGVVEGKVGEAEVLAGQTPAGERIREMATAYLKSIGEEVPEAVSETGLLGDLTSLIRRLKLPINSEDEMQFALAEAFGGNLSDDIAIQREYKFSKRSRVDFLASRGTERVFIECKIDQTDRASVFRQVRRYIEEGENVSALILVAPWHGVPAFIVDGVPVVVLDTNVNSI